MTRGCQVTVIRAGRAGRGAGDAFFLGGGLVCPGGSRCGGSDLFLDGTNSWGAGSGQVSKPRPECDQSWSMAAPEQDQGPDGVSIFLWNQKRGPVCPRNDDGKRSFFRDHEPAFGTAVGSGDHRARGERRGRARGRIPGAGSSGLRNRSRTAAGARLVVETAIISPKMQPALMVGFFRKTSVPPLSLFFQRRGRLFCPT